MKISRRTFLSGITGTTATLFSFQPLRAGRHSAAPGHALDCALLDLKSHCALPESLNGYQTALAGSYNHLPETWAGERSRCRIVIVPALGHMYPAMANALSDLVNDGACLLLESGAGFLSPAEFVTHQKLLNRYFNLTVEPPIDLWSGRFFDNAYTGHRLGRHPRKKMDSHEIIPYVSYVWPQETKVRDFSRIVPVSMQAGEVIGRVGAMSVALKKRVGTGTLIFLGSPLGPALGARDPEARRWLQSVSALYRSRQVSRQPPKGR